jgi:putative DNA primase/helicase
MTKRANTAYDPAARSTLWEQFLERVIPDPDVRAFLQRAAGYSLTGTVGEHVIFLLLGGGANGKSTFVNTLRHVLGDYATVARKDLFVVTKQGQHDSSRVALQGARFVSAAEIERGTRLAEAEIKELTGGERITARRLYGQAYEIDPTWKLWLSANHRPHVYGTDEAMWRRIRLIEWPVTIPAGERDPELPTKLAGEAPGILNWTLDGLRQWLDIGLAEPAAVIMSTASYRAREDLVGRFLTDNDLTLDVDDPRLIIETTELTTLRERWCQENGEQLTARSLGLELQDRGAVSERTTKVRKWRFLGRIDDAMTLPVAPTQESLDVRVCIGESPSEDHEASCVIDHTQREPDDLDDDNQPF